MRPTQTSDAAKQQADDGVSEPVTPGSAVAGGAGAAPSSARRPQALELIRRAGLARRRAFGRRAGTAPSNGSGVARPRGAHPPPSGGKSETSSPGPSAWSGKACTPLTRTRPAAPGSRPMASVTAATVATSRGSNS